MYSRTIKKSITIFLSCTLLSAACLFSTAEAASISAPTASIPICRAQLIYSNEDSEIGTDGVESNIGGITGTYEVNVPINLSALSADSYVNGLCSYNLSCAFSNYSDFAIESVNIWYEGNSISGIYSALNKTTASSIGTSSRLVVGFENYWTIGSSFAIGNLHMIISGRIVGSVRSVPRYIDCTFSISNQATFLNASPDPEDQSLASIIKQAIINALEDTSLGSNDVSVAEYMNLYLQYLYNISSDIGYFRTNYLTWLAELENDWLGVIIDNQDAAEVVYNAINSNISAFQALVSGNEAQIINKLSNMENYLYQILHQGENATEGQSEAEVEASKLQNQIDIIAGQPTLDINDVFSDIDAGAAANGQAAADIYFWTWDGKIAGILATTMSLALIGFIVYGKSG